MRLQFGNHEKTCCSCCVCIYLQIHCIRSTCENSLLHQSFGHVFSSVHANILQDSRELLQRVAHLIWLTLTQVLPCRAVSCLDRWQGLFGRGLRTRILTNGLQSILFTVVWRYLHDKYVDNSATYTDHTSRHHIQCRRSPARVGWGHKR